MRALALAAAPDGMSAAPTPMIAVPMSCVAALVRAASRPPKTTRAIPAIICAKINHRSPRGGAGAFSVWAAGLAKGAMSAAAVAVDVIVLPRVVGKVGLERLKAAASSDPVTLEA